MEFWHDVDADSEAHDDGQPREELRLEREQVMIRQRMMKSIADDVVDGRVTLAEATSLFSELNKQPRDLTAIIRRNFPADTERQSVARQVISWSTMRVAADPSRSRALTIRLNREFAAMLREEK
jgi:hypothetical protein